MAYDLFEYYRPTKSTVKEEKPYFQNKYYIPIIKKHIRGREGFFTAMDMAKELYPEKEWAFDYIKQSLEWLEQHEYLCYGPDKDGIPTYCTEEHWNIIHPITKKNV